MSPGGDVADSGAGSSCADCEWRLKPQCEIGGKVICGRIAMCDPIEPGGPRRTLYDIYLRRGAGEWRLVTSFCLDNEDDLVTTEDVGERIEQQWQAFVPEQVPTSQPPKGRTLVNLPTYFHSGQPAEMAPVTRRVFDFEVVVAARGEWRWKFDNGAQLAIFDVPGSKHGDSNPVVQHTYRTADKRTVQLTTYWHGSFNVGPYGPYDIDEPVIQGPRPIPIQVVQTRAELGG